MIAATIGLVSNVTGSSETVEELKGILNRTLSGTRDLIRNLTEDQNRVLVHESSLWCIRPSQTEIFQHM